MFLNSKVPSIGIIVPCYNSEATIINTLQSIKKLKIKKCDEFKIYCVLIDDCSSDNTDKFIKVYILDGTIDKYHKNDSNLDVSYSRNIGLNYCSKTDYVTFCDADDLLYDIDFEIIANNQHVDIFFFDNLISNGKISKIISHKKYITTPIIDRFALLKYAKLYMQRPNAYSLWVTSWSKIFKTSIIVLNNINFDAKLRLFEDVKFNFDFIFHANAMMYIDKVMYDYHIPDGAKIVNSSTMGAHSDVVGMFSFLDALTSLKTLLKKIEPKVDFGNEISHCISVYTIITLIRVSLKVDSLKSLNEIYRCVRKILATEPIYSSFDFYSFKKAHGSFFIPFLLKRKLCFLAFIFCTIKGRKRYM